jgi:DNA repair protein RecO (recombination protein O)
MLEKTKALVLRSIKYSESSLITTFYTELFGLKTYLLRGVQKSKKGSLRPAYFQPLMQLHIAINPHKKGSLYSLKEASVAHYYQTIYTDVKKNTIVLFLSEVLGQVIKEETPDLELFEYLENAFLWFDHHEGIANFHLLFLINLTKFLGFYPSLVAQDHPYFDLLEGKFTSQLSNYTLANQELALFKKLLSVGFNELQLIKLDVIARRALLQILMTYYQLHIEGFTNPRSIKVLSALFS